MTKTECHRSQPGCFQNSSSGFRQFVALLIALLLGGVAARTADSRPNLVFIIADDMGTEDCGAYGHPHIRTPNIDRLAREGMRFEHAFLTCSSCSPSRSSMITGRYPHSTGAEQLHWPLPKEQVTFVEKLKAAGYWTAQAGKWHLGDAIKDRFDVVHEGSSAAFQLSADARGKAAKMKADVDESGCAGWIPTMRERPKDKPFFLWLASFDPHRDYEENIIPRPHRAEDIVVPPFLPDTPEVRKDLGLYYDEIARLDSYVGKVLDELAAQGVADNTFVLFTSDNGRPFPRCKTTVYDSGIQTPLIARWPGKIKPGSTSASLISSVDYAPTFLELAGLKAGPTFQGKSFAPVLRNPQATIRDYIFGEHNWHDFEAHERAVRSAKFKYIRNDYPDLPGTPPADALRSLTSQAMRRLRDAGKLTPDQMNCFIKPRPAEELYDLQTDPNEFHNLATDPHQAGTLKQMRQALADWQLTTGDSVPKFQTADDFDRETGDPLPTRVRPRLPPKK